MSGGHFQYKQYRITEMVEEIEELITNNDNTEKDQYGDPIGYGFPPEIIDRFKEAAHTLRLAAAMAQRVDWLVSGDDGPDSFIRRWDEEISKIKEEV